MGGETALEEDSDVDFIDFRMVELLVTGDLEKIYLELEEDPDVDLLYGWCCLVIFFADKIGGEGETWIC